MPTRPLRPSGHRNVIHHEHLLEEAAQHGDKRLVRRLMEILLLEGFLRGEGQREDVRETLIEASRNIFTAGR